jgi:hypothetical protein
MTHAQAAPAGAPPAPGTSARVRTGRLLMGVAIVGTILIVAVADIFNGTHLFNPDWPPHARFHNAMQAWTLLLVSCVSLAGLLRGRIGVAAIAPATFWPSLWLSWPVPGTTPYASPALADLGVPVNLVIAVLMLALTALAAHLARDR